jgi:dTDP-4-amino-4,6-dideoxygalactose transaminase
MRKPENTISSSWIYSILVDDRVDFIDHMTNNDIQCDRVHVRNDEYSVFGGKREDLKNLKEFDSNLVNIPVGWWLSQENLNYITEIVNKY